MPLRYILITLSLLGLFSSASYSQSEFIDRSFGDNGTLSFENDTLEAFALLGVDSLDNVYISHSELDTATDIQTYKLIKLNNKGETIYFDRLIDSQDSTSILILKDNILIRNAFIGGSSFIYTHDLNFNLINRFIVPAGVKTASLKPYPDGRLEGLTNGFYNTFFNFGSDGFLDKTFSEDGLIMNEQDTSDIYGSIGSANRLKEQSLLFTELRIDSSYYYQSQIKLYSQDGYQLLDYETENLSYPNSLNDNLQYNYVYDSFETKDDNLIMKGFFYDTLYNPNYYLTKLDIDGFTMTNFADNGFLLETPNAGHASGILDYCFFINQFSNGNLLHTCHIRDSIGQVSSRHLTLYNENGIKEPNFGINSKLELESLKGQYSPLQFLFNDEVYILKYDTIQHRNDFGNIILTENTATHITKLSTEKLLDYEPISPPEESNFILYPNPITSRSLIEYNGLNLEDISLRIYNMNGQLTQEQFIPSLFNYGQIQIDIVDYPDGIYFLQIIDEDEEIWSTKLIKLK